MRSLIPALALCAAVSGCGERSSPVEARSVESIAAPAASAPPRLTLDALPLPYNSADLANGEAAFAKCGGCHLLDPAQGHRVGPNLHGVFDRPPGTAEDFRYSEALQAMSLDRWTPAELEKWLADPRGYLPGSSMFFNGIDDPASRRDIIAHLLIESR